MLSLLTQRIRLVLSQPQGHRHASWYQARYRLECRLLFGAHTPGL